MYQLITIPGTCSTGIHVLLNQLNIDAEIINRDDFKDYKKIVPTNQVPALITGDGVLTEGAAIVLYLLDKHKVDIEIFGGKTIFNQWLMFNYATLHPAYGRMFSVYHTMEESSEKQTLLKALAGKVSDTWQIINNRLAKQKYLTGDNATVMDYLLAIYVSWGQYFPTVDMPVGENVLRLVNDVREHSVFKDAYLKEGAVFNVPENAK